MNVAALLQDSPSEDRRRPVHHQQQQHQQSSPPQQQQTQHRPEHASVVADRDSAQPPPPPLSTFQRHTAYRYNNDYHHPQQHQSHSAQLPPPSSFLQPDAFDPAHHRPGGGSGPRPLNPELLTHNHGHKLGQQRASEPFDVRPVSSGPPPPRPPTHHSHSHTYGHPPPMYIPPGGPPGSGGPGPGDYPHHPLSLLDRDLRLPRPPGPPVQTLQLYPLPRTRPRTPPPTHQSSSTFPVPAPVPMPVPLTLSPSPLYTGPGSAKAGSPAMGSLPLPRPSSLHAAPPPRPPLSHVQTVTVTSGVTKSANGRAQTSTPHMEGPGGNGRHFGFGTSGEEERMRQDRREFERDRDRLREIREREDRERERNRYALVMSLSEREREIRERERDRRDVETKKDREREFRDDPPRHQNLALSPERNGGKREREREVAERERERDRREREIADQGQRSSARERDRDRMLHLPHHHHLIHHHHMHSSPHGGSPSRSQVESGLLTPSSSQQQMERHPNPESLSPQHHLRQPSHTHVHTHPLPVPQQLHHQQQPPPLSRPQTHILDLSVNTPTPPPLSQPPHPSQSQVHSQPPFFTHQPSPHLAHHNSHSHNSHISQHPQSTMGLVPIPLSLSKSDLHPRTPPPIPPQSTGIIPLQAVPSSSSSSFALEQHEPQTPPIPKEIISLGTFIYPRTPFPYRGQWDSCFEPGLDGFASNTGSLESKPKDLRAEILVSSLYLPDRHTTSEIAPGLKGHRISKRRIWGGGLATPAVRVPNPSSSGYVLNGGFYSTQRVYTDDSDLLLCAIHAGFVTWSGVRRARRERRDLRVVVRILRGVVSRGGGGVALGRFLGGFGAECLDRDCGMGKEGDGGGVNGLTGEEEEEEEGEGIEDDGRGLMSAGWGNGHDGAGIEIISAEFLEKGFAHSKSYPNRSQRLREYAERRRDILDPRRFSSPIATPTSPDEPLVQTDLNTRSRKRRKLCREESACFAKTIVFGMGAMCTQAGFKYDPATMQSILFPPTSKSRQKRRLLDDADDAQMDVDEEVFDAAATDDVEENKRSRGVILETLKESFLVYRFSSADSDVSEEKENVGCDGEQGGRGRRYVIALRKDAGKADSEGNDPASNESATGGKSGADVVLDESDGAPDSTKPSVVEDQNNATDPSALKPELPNELSGPSSPPSLQILQRDIGEDQMLLDDTGVTIFCAVEEDGTRKGFLIEVKTWRWADA